MTTKGYIGIRPPYACLRDSVYILLRAKTPFITRKYGDYFLLFRGSYVHGLMDREAIQQIEDGKLGV